VATLRISHPRQRATRLVDFDRGCLRAFEVASGGVNQFNPARMMRYLRSSIVRLEKFLNRKPKPLDPSSLMGMYLSQTNRPTGSSTRGTGTRERQDGKFAQIRRRAGER
jgi:hypothetical protein